MTETPPAVPGDPAGSWARILGDVAHELRGAAGGADLWLELLARAPDETSRERAVTELRRALGHSVGIAEELADAAALLGEAASEPALPFELGAALAASHRRVLPEARARGVTLELAVPAGFSHTLLGDEAAWGRALDRILGAAIAHAPGGVTHALRISTTASGGAELSIPCGELCLPPARPLLEAWSESRPAGMPFPLGSWLARAHLERAGGRLEIRDAADGRRLVAVTA